MLNLKNLFIPTPANNYRALLISNTALAIYAITLILLNVFAGGFGIRTSYALLDEGVVVELHNQERAKLGLDELKINPSLNASAKAKGEAMLTSDCWSHYCPNGKSPWDFFRDAGYDYSFAGENLAEGFSSSEAMQRAWMNSKTHRENILKPEFTEIGIAMVVGEFQGVKNNTIVVVHFGKPRFTGVTTPTTLPTSQGVEITQIPEITSPIDGSETVDTRPTISGRYDRDVEIEIGAVKSGRVSPEGGIFTYVPEANLESGTHSLQARDIDFPSNASVVIKFTVLGTSTDGQPISADGGERTDIERQSLVLVDFANPIQAASFGLVLFLITLFVVDFIVVKRTNLKYNLKIKSRSHLHLPSLVVLLTLTIMGNIHGAI